MKRKITGEDLRDKGLPFECSNCGRKPALAEVLEHGGECQLCGDDVFAYTVDTAKLLATLMSNATHDGLAIGRTVDGIVGNLDSGETL